MKYIVVYDSNSNDIDKYLSEMRKVLEEKNIDFDMKAYEDIKSKSIDPMYDTVIVFGGDGTIFSTAKEMTDDKKILAINTGTIGFLSAVDKDSNYEQVMQNIIDNKYFTKDIGFLSVYINDKKYIAFNECLISVESIGLMGKYDVYLDNTFVNDFHSDGIIISTATGATAYTFSLNAPIVDDNLKIYIITPINPHSFSNRSIILNGNKTVYVDIMRSNEKIILDGREEIKINKGDKIKISYSDKKVSFIYFDEPNIYDRIKNKLKTM